MSTTRKSRATLDHAVAATLSVPATSPPTKFQSIGATRQPWPLWLVALRDASGVYVIRDARTKRPLYVGSSSGSLYDTVTRHFQSWSRAKKWWKGMRGQHDPGVVYHRDHHEVLIALCSKVDRLHAEAAAIERYKPADNLVAHPDGAKDEVPF